MYRLTEAWRDPKANAPSRAPYTVRRAQLAVTGAFLLGIGIGWLINVTE